MTFKSEFKCDKINILSFLWLAKKIPLFKIANANKGDWISITSQNWQEYYMYVYGIIFWEYVSNYDSWTSALEFLCSKIEIEIIAPRAVIKAKWKVNKWKESKKQCNNIQSRLFWFLKFNTKRILKSSIFWQFFLTPMSSSEGGIPN